MDRSRPPFARPRRSVLPFVGLALAAGLAFPAIAAAQSDPDAAVRANRLALLARIRAATGQVADFSRIAG